MDNKNTGLKMTNTLSKLFLRDLEKLKTEISSFKDEKNIWKISGDIKNSSGNLCLHLCGNLQHFIGAVLGNSGYVRNRDAEFARKDVPIRDLVAEIELSAKVVQKTLLELNEDELQKTYPINVLGFEMTTEFFLTHLTTHLNYHLGQINYHRRLLDF
jgi:uncharacterized damage-inducible protein DinB